MVDGWRDERLRRTAAEMADCLAHRGPDDHGVWVDASTGVALGHRRLSILDLSPAGHQPMVSASGRYVMVFNGEIYNFPDLRTKLEACGVRFRGASDTEVLLAAIDRWGLEVALKRAHGMFAVGVWDTKERTLSLARDRLGEKPLYYGWHGRSFLFASELTAVRAHPDFAARVSRESVVRYLALDHVPAPASIYEGTFKLPPGTFAIVRPNRVGVLPEPKEYWSARDAVTSDGADVPDNNLEVLLADAVARQMVADVPLGLLLSGGVDSSTIAALMQAQSARPVRTFTIGFKEAGFDEAEYAGAVARHLGTDHTELYVTPADAEAVIPRLPEIYDEPFADSSQIPTFLVCKMARRSVTVALSGDGGDEVFGGYNRYLWWDSLWNRARRLPSWGRTAAACALNAVPPRAWDRVGRALQHVSRSSSRLADGRLGERAEKAIAVLRARTPTEAYQQLISHWASRESIVLGAGTADEQLNPPLLASFVEQMMYLDLVGYLPDDILTKVDRASMAVNLEVRVPFLDHRVVEAAWRLPLEAKIAGGRGKLPLRRILDRYVPSELIERPKAGFAVPIGTWLRGPLRPWAEELLDERRLRADGILDPAPIRRRWDAHVRGRGQWEHHLWGVLIFQAWLDAQGVRV